MPSGSLQTVPPDVLAAATALAKIANQKHWEPTQIWLLFSLEAHKFDEFLDAERAVELAVEMMSNSKQRSLSNGNQKVQSDRQDSLSESANRS